MTCPYCGGSGWRWYVSVTDPDDVDPDICDCPAGTAKEARDATGLP